MHHTSVIEISKSAYRNNVKFLREQLGEEVIISSVVKGNAYGHGIENIVSIAEEAGIRHFSTFSVDEAQRVVNASTKQSQIMVMGMLDNSSLPWLIQNGINFYVFEFDRLRAAIHEAKALGIKANIHIEVETGLHRTGFEWHKREKLLKLLKENSLHIEFKGLCTHYAGAESINNYFRIHEQIKNFHAFKNWFSDNGVIFQAIHTACSAASLSYPETVMDMVRIGIAQYGLWPSQETYMSQFKQLAPNKKNPLKRLITWKSTVMSTKKIEMGEFIGYGSSFMTNRPTTIALVPIGYSHGFSRVLGNGGKVLIHGKTMPVIGSVNMNSITVDVTDLGNVDKGDEVIIIGKQKKNEITVAAFGEAVQQVNYELLTRLPHDIPRVITR